MKRFSILLFSGLLCYTSFAQKNRIEIQSGGFSVLTREQYMLKEVSYQPLPTLNLSYQRTITKSIGVFTSLGTNTPIANGGKFVAFNNERVMTKTNYSTWCPVGGALYLSHRINYFNADLGISLALFQSANQHRLSALLGVSTTGGTNRYTTIKWESPVKETYFDKYEQYYGALLGLKYDYTFGQGKWNIGAHGIMHGYVGNMTQLVNYGLQLGFNF